MVKILFRVCLASHSPVTHLVNGTWNQTLDVFPLPKYLWEGGTEGRRCLHRRETYFAHVVTVLETKARLDLIGRDALLNAQDLSIEAWHRTVVGEKLDKH